MLSLNYVKNEAEKLREKVQDKTKVASIIFDDKIIVTSGVNTAFTDVFRDSKGNTLSSVLHAEEVALMKLLSKNNRSSNHSLYVTYAPCEHCASLIVQSGIVKNVYFSSLLNENSKGIDILKNNGISICQLL